MESAILCFEKKWNLRLEQHTTLVILLSRVLAFILLMTMIFVLGFLGRKFFMNFLLRVMDRILSHIPFVRTIYRLTNEITKAIFSDTKKTFKETVLVPFPHHDAHAIGFLTGDSPSIFKEKTHTDHVIFVPTSPHPMSGFVLLTPKKIVLPVDVSVEDAFKFIISCGVIHPGEHPPATSTPLEKP